MIISGCVGINKNLIEFSLSVLKKVTPVRIDTKTDVWDMAVNDEYIFSAHKDNDVRVWDVKSCKLVKVLTGHAATVHAIDARGSVLAVGTGWGSTYELVLWDVLTWEKLATLNDHNGNVWRVKLKNNTLVTAGMDRTAIVYNIGHAKQPVLLHRLEGHTEVVSDVDFDDRRVVTASFDETLIVSPITLLFADVVKCIADMGHQNWREDCDAIWSH